MKRDPALVSLSHDHHQALFVARALRRATGKTLADDRAQFLAYWNTHGRTHFVAHVLCDHVAIRRPAGKLGNSTTPSPSIVRDPRDEPLRSAD